MDGPDAPPKPGIAAVLGLVGGPIGLLYVGRPGFAAFAVLTSVGFSLLHLIVLGRVQHAELLLAIVFATLCAVGSAWFAARYPKGRARPSYSRWPGLLAVAVALLAARLSIALFWFETFVMHSGSMLPGIAPQSRVLVSKLVETVERGDVVVFFPGNELNYEQPRVARLIGLPGDQVVYRAKRLTINGQAADYAEQAAFTDPRSATRQPQLVERIGEVEYSIRLDPGRVDEFAKQPEFPYRETCAFSLSGFECHVPPGHYLMLGDNRDRSADSRLYGYVPADGLVGKVVLAFR